MSEVTKEWFNEGVAAQRINTEKEKKRAEAAEAEIQKLREELKLLKNQFTETVSEVKEKQGIEEYNNQVQSNTCEIYDQIEQQGIQKGIEQGIERGIEQGKKESIISLFQKGLLSASDAAAELKVKEEEFLKIVKNNG